MSKQVLLFLCLLLPVYSGTILDESFEVPLDTLPVGWSSFTAAGTGNPWSVSPYGTASVSATNLAEIQLYSPLLTVTCFPATLTLDFAVLNNTGANAGMALEYSVNGGLFEDVLSGGAQFVLGGYNGEISSAVSPNPLLRGAAFRKVWQAYTGTTVVRFEPFQPSVPAALQFRLVVGADEAQNAAGRLNSARLTDSEVTPVPEPVSWALCFGAICFLLFRGKRRLLPMLLALPAYPATIIDETFNIPTGTLPANWFSAVAVGSGVEWAANGDGHVSTGVAGYSEVQLYSPLLTVRSFPASLALSIDANSRIHANFGMVLEYSQDGAPYQDVLSSGARFVYGGYDGEITSADPNPLLRGAGFRKVWQNYDGPALVEFDPFQPVLPTSIQFRLTLGGGESSGGYSYLFDFVLNDSSTPPAPVPEPATWTLAAGALGAVVLRRYLR